MCRHHRNQRHILAAAIVTTLQEYQQSKSRDPPSSRSFQEPMTRGIAYLPPNYSSSEGVDPNPPSYEEVPSSTTNIIDEKQRLYRLSTEEQVPPHAMGEYNRNTGLSDERGIPAPPLITLSPATTTTTNTTTHTSAAAHPESLTHLLNSITLYFDTQIKLHSSNPSLVRKLEYKKAKKLLKAEKKYQDHFAKGKDGKYESKMEKRAEKMEKWADVVVKRSVGRHEKFVRRHGGCCGDATLQAQAQAVGH
ncbi:hypothetical protein TWF481_003593 [Arthrobotrys musiformis]|uniref:Uncharacterized protein n=1 Tax=Arthrobotrys musiformis TaxID=47236 RepID=A0AAV9WIY6_9PEZI